ncbi:MAG: PTS sugar transporter subunit IIB [Tissierellia bacterium]|nr:PTS sugar transporter subunit IIB [Tissierellia bacterium]
MIIQLYCSAGMSTSMLVKKMRDEAEKRGLDAQINAYQFDQIADKVKEADVAFLGPQVQFQLKAAQKEADKYNVALEVIPMKDYGMMNGKAVLDRALELCKK